jgi:large conductance mechanosensitive channel
MKMWRQFKGFALSGSMLDLALGFIIGTAFATVVDSATRNVITPGIGYFFGAEGLGKLHGRFYRADGTPLGPRITYGQFLVDILNFFLFAVVLFMILKFIGMVGLGRNRDFEERQCPYCLEWIAPHSLVCKVCRQPLVAELPDLAAAEARAAKLRERRHLKLPIDIKEFDLPDIRVPDINLPKVRRRPAKSEPGAASHSPSAPTATLDPPDEDDLPRE